MQVPHLEEEEEVRDEMHLHSATKWDKYVVVRVIRI